jgi:flagellar basal body-associated protein FliL
VVEKDGETVNKKKLCWLVFAVLTVIWYAAVFSFAPWMIEQSSRFESGKKYPDLPAFKHLKQGP